MSISARAESGARRSASLLMWLLFFLSPLVTTAIPRLTWLFLPLASGSLILSASRSSGVWRQLTLVNITLITCLVVAAYVFLNASWAADPATALGKAVLLLSVLLLMVAASRAIPEVREQQLHDCAFAVVIGTVLASVFLTFELLTDGALTRLTLNSFHLFSRLDHKHFDVSRGEIVGLNLSDLNQNVAVLTLNLWPALLVIRTIENLTRRLLIATAILLAVAVPVALSQHQSSQVALVSSIIVFLLAIRWPKAVIRSLAALWCLAFVFVLPADFLAYKADLHMAQWLPKSFRARIIIWEYTAERVLDRPWLGVGADSTRYLKEPNTLETAEQPPGFVYPRTIGWHAHDLFLQTWFELGVVGAVLFAFAGGMLALRMLLLPAGAQPYAAASFMAFVGIAAFAWGMWQTWLICAEALMVVYLLVAAKIDTPFDQPWKQTGKSTSRKSDVIAQME
jgi:O-antigen ligase